MTENAPHPPGPQPSGDVGPDPASTSHTGKYIIAALVILLLILHQDNWFWTSDYLVFGFMPIGLFYHACISIAAACVWYLATKIAWPVEIIQRAYTADSNEVPR